MSRLHEIELEHFRCHSALRLADVETDWVVLGGDNGSGKSSLLEAIYIATRGRSFRTNTHSEVIEHQKIQAHVLIRATGARPHVLGTVIGNRGRDVHLDGGATDLTAIAEAIPVEYLGGDSVQLASASPGEHRRFMDWALFHVEPRFLSSWRNWYRAHRQRNALLKRNASERALAPWTEAVALHGRDVTAYRQQFINRLQDILEKTRCGRIGGGRIEFRPGWRGEDLREALRDSAPRETQQGRAVVGPQQDDWTLEIAGQPARELSRGQVKLASALLYRCQAAVMQSVGRNPIYLMDDLAADLDPQALAAVIELWSDAGLQIWVTMLSDALGLALPGTAARFHVEHGRARRL